MSHHLQKAPIEVTADSSSETMACRRKYQNDFQVRKDKNCQPHILYLAKLSFMTKGEINIVSDN